MNVCLNLPDLKLTCKSAILDELNKSRTTAPHLVRAIKMKFKMNQLTNFLAFISLLFFLSIDVKSQEVTQAHKDSLRNLVEQYYSLNLKVYQQNSTREDVDNLFSLFTEDFVYVHPKYGGEYARKDLYDGYINNQKNGSYNGSITDVEIKNMIIGLNALVTDRVYLRKAESGELEEVDPGMTLYEFRNGKISRIFEYW